MKSAAPPPFGLPDRYKYDNETLSGGEGVVYICRDTNLDRRVAIKALHPSGSTASLKKEVAARGKIRSKHVAELYEVLYTSSGKPLALVLEFIPGVILQDGVSSTAPLEQRLLLLYQVACGLDEIHAAGVIHRDVKPHNIKVDDSGVLKIFDLGLANLDADKASTVGGAGTLVYRAPEVYGTAPVVLTRAVDIYALGVVAWYVLVGKFPAGLLEVPPQQLGSLRSLATEVPTLGVTTVVLDRSLSVDPLKRPTAREIAEALKARITKGRRRGVLSHSNSSKRWELKASGDVTTLNVNAFGSVSVMYDGDCFFVKDVTGTVFLNNMPAVTSLKLPDSCVVTFGDQSGGTARVFVAFNASQPEIVI